MQSWERTNKRWNEMNTVGNLISFLIKRKSERKKMKLKNCMYTYRDDFPICIHNILNEKS